MITELEKRITALYEKQDSYNDDDLLLFEEFRTQLEKGSIRAAEKDAGGWQANIWVKKGILVGFKLGKLSQMPWSDTKVFWDKSTYPERRFTANEGFRIVPGGSSVRSGAYVGQNVTMMPPSYVNVGAYVDDGTMLDSHCLVGSCAQIGKNVHISAAAIIGGVLEPIGSNPVIIEDEAFIGGNCGVYEGVTVLRQAILAAGVILTAATKVYDAVNKRFLIVAENKPLTIPERAVVISGNRMLKEHEGISLYCPVIIKYRDAKSERSVTLEDWLR